MKVSRFESKQEALEDKRKARRLVRDEIPENPSAPSGSYSLIYCDPPWRYEHSWAKSRDIENHYPTMQLEDICALQVPAAADCVMFMWATAPKLAESLEVVSAWGFTYRTCAVWAKDKIGMGYYFRQQTELLLVCAKGSPGTPATGNRPSSLITAPRLKHSAKPPEVRATIEAMYPNHSRIELFAREPAPGWDSWGNEISH